MRIERTATAPLVVVTMRPSPRLIAMSGFGQEGDRERSLLAGFDEHLVKPVAGDQLVTAIVAALGTGDG